MYKAATRKLVAHLLTLQLKSDWRSDKASLCMTPYHSFLTHCHALPFPLTAVLIKYMLRSKYTRHTLHHACGKLRSRFHWKVPTDGAGRNKEDASLNTTLMSVTSILYIYNFLQRLIRIYVHFVYPMFVLPNFTQVFFHCWSMFHWYAVFCKTEVLCIMPLFMKQWILTSASGTSQITSLLMITCY